MKTMCCLQGGPGKAGTPSKLHTTEQPAQLVSVLEANDLTEMMSMVGCCVLLSSSTLVRCLSSILTSATQNFRPSHAAHAFG